MCAGPSSELPLVSYSYRIVSYRIVWQLFQTLGRLTPGSHKSQEVVAPAEDEGEEAAEAEGAEAQPQKGDKQVIVAKVMLRVNYEVRKGAMEVHVTNFGGTQELGRVVFTASDTLQLRYGSALESNRMRCPLQSFP